MRLSGYADDQADPASTANAIPRITCRARNVHREDRAVNLSGGGQAFLSGPIGVEPLARDSRDARRGASNEGEAELRLLANLCEVAPEFVTGLHMADYIQVQNAYRGFLEPPLP